MESRYIANIFTTKVHSNPLLQKKTYFPKKTYRLEQLGSFQKRPGRRGRQIDNLGMIRMVAENKGTGDIRGEIQHNALLFRRAQKFTGALFVTAFVQVENSNHPSAMHNFILSQVKLHSRYSPFFPDSLNSCRSHANHCPFATAFLTCR